MRGESRDVDNHLYLFNAISNGSGDGVTTGNNIVSDGSVVRVAQCEYNGLQGKNKGAPYLTSDIVYYLYDKYLDLVCADQPHTCVLDRNNQREIMLITNYTGSSTLTIAGFIFGDGEHAVSSPYGGGLRVEYGGIVVLELCDFTSNSAELGGAIFTTGGGTQLDIFSTTFLENTATNFGNGIFIHGGSVTVHNTCPEGWTGSPTTGSTLNIFMQDGTANSSSQG